MKRAGGILVFRICLLFSDIIEISRKDAVISWRSRMRVRKENGFIYSAWRICTGYMALRIAVIIGEGEQRQSGITLIVFYKSLSFRPLVNLAWSADCYGISIADCVNYKCNRIPFGVKLEQPGGETMSATLEAERIVHDPSVKHNSDVEEALKKLKRWDVPVLALSRMDPTVICLANNIYWRSNSFGNKVIWILLVL